MRARGRTEIMLTLCMVSVLTIVFDVTTVFAHSADIIVAVGGSTPTIDGLIEVGEWDDACAGTVSVTGGANCTVYTKQDGANLYVGFDIPDVTYNSTDCCGIIFDVNHDENISLQTDDIWLHISRKGSLRENNVTKQNGMGWFETSVSGWTANASSAASAWQSEYNITYSKLDVSGGANKTLGVMFLIVDKDVMVYNVWPHPASILEPVTWGDMTPNGYNWRADTTPPTISILSPENKTYTVNDIPLTFTVSELTPWIGYSLDGQINVTITENTTLTDLLDGMHYVVFYANDTAGNMGVSSTVYFSVDTTHPNITDVSQTPPENNVLPEDEVKINAAVNDNLRGVKQVILNYTYTNSSGTWIRVVDMTNHEGNIWNATIPAFPYCTNVTYTIMAEDNAGNIITTEDMGYEYQYHVIPEFPSFIILSLFIIAALLTVIIYRRSHLKMRIVKKKKS